jgi:hypothetical protein
MSIGTNQDPDGSDQRGVGLAETVAMGFFVVETFVILGFVAAGIANQVKYGGQQFGVEGSSSSHVWGYTLSIASEWSAPGIVVGFLLGPLALVAWTRMRGGPDIAGGRRELVLRLALGLAVLTVLGGILSIVGRVLELSPSQQWSGFFGVLGNGVGAICLGLLTIFVVTRLSGDMQLDAFARRSGDDLADGEAD